MTSGRSRILERIRRDVLDGLWAPGERLQPMNLAAQYDTSTTVVREAMSLLAGDGLIISRPNHGFFVQTLDLRQLEDLTDLRCVAEEFAAHLATERGDVKWEAELTAAHHTLSRTPRRLAEDPEVVNPEWAAAHRQFHHLLISASECAPAIQLSANLADATELYRRWSAKSDAARNRNVEQEHLALLHAALERDGDRLGALLRAHYQATVDVVINAGLLPHAVTA